MGNVGFQIAFNIGFSMAIVSSFYLLFYVKERISKAKHLQFVSGVGVISFWFPSFLCDILMFLFTSLCVVVTVFLFQQDGFKTVEELGKSIIPFSPNITSYYCEPTRGSLMVLVIFLVSEDV